MARAWLRIRCSWSPTASRSANFVFRPPMRAAHAVATACLRLHAAPAVIARSLDAAEYLHFMPGEVDGSFVRTAADLQRRLERLDLHRDPDGRCGVNDFCCADAAWRATALALMDRAGVVSMDLRGVTSRRRGGAV